MELKNNINIFIENIYENFEKTLDLSKLTQDTISMVQEFLKKQEWVQNSCLADYKYKLLYFDIVLCDNENIQEINRNYRQIDKPTDVITFAIFADSPKEERFIFDDEINLGEIIISLDKALQQSIEQDHCNKTFEQELYFLLAHGILHLLGYDHQDETSLQKMWSIQEKLINPEQNNV